MRVPSSFRSQRGGDLVARAVRDLLTDKIVVLNNADLYAYQLTIGGEISVIQAPQKVPHDAARIYILSKGIDAPPSSFLNPANWTAAEAASDADTRRTYVEFAGPPPTGKKRAIYRGTQREGLLTALAPEVYDPETNTFSWTSTGRAERGQTSYVRIAETNIDGSSPRWITQIEDVKSFVASNTPMAPSLSWESNGPGSVLITLAPPEGRGREVFTGEYQISGGNWTEFPVAATLTLTGLTDGVSTPVSVRWVNANGASTATTQSVISENPNTDVPPTINAMDSLDGMILTISVASYSGNPTPDLDLTTLTLDGKDVLEDAVPMGPGVWAYTKPSSFYSQTIVWEVTASSTAGVATSGGDEEIAADLEAEFKENPAFRVQPYAGGYYVVDSYGSINTGEDMSTTLQASMDGINYDDLGLVETPTFSGGAGYTIPAIYEGGYVRIASYAGESDMTAYSVPVGPLRANFNRNLSFAGSGNHLKWALSGPLLGMGTGNDVNFWMMALRLKPSAGADVKCTAAFGVAGSALKYAILDTGAVSFRDSTQAYSNIGGTYDTDTRYALQTGHFWNENGFRKSQALYDDVVAPEVSASGAINISTWNELRLGSRLDGSNETGCDLSFFALGRGKPDALQAWCYNDGMYRDPRDYDFASDPYGATFGGFMLLSKKDDGTPFSVNDARDLIGNLGAPTLVGSLAWAARAPGYVDARDIPPDTPAVFVQPMIGNTGEEYTFCSNLHEVGAADPTKFAITSMTHPTLGNILPTVTAAKKFTPSAPGDITITASYDGGAPVTFVVNVQNELAWPDQPIFADRFEGNAIAAGIMPYVDPGPITYVPTSLAALQTDILQLGAGETMVIGDISGDTDISLSNKDFGGATIIAKNLHGVDLNKLTITHCKNLNIRGFAYKEEVEVTGSSEGVLLGHNTGRRYHCVKKIAPGVGKMTVEDWISRYPVQNPNAGMTNGQNGMNSYGEAVLRRAVMAGSTYADVMQWKGNKVINAERVVLAHSKLQDYVGSLAHPDMWQIMNNTGGFTKAYLNKILIIDYRDMFDPAGDPADPENYDKESQGIFLSDAAAPRYFRVRNAAVVIPGYNGITLASTQSGCSIEDSTCPNTVNMKGTAKSALARNILMKSSAPVIAPGGGPIIDVEYGLDFSKVFPKWDTHRNWEKFENPVGRAGKGADRYIQEIRAAYDRLAA